MSESGSSTVRNVVAVIGALALAVLAAFLLVAALRGTRFGSISIFARERAGVRTSSAAVPRMTIAARLEAAPLEAVAQTNRRAVPPDVLRTASVSAAPWAPGLRLVRAAVERTWEERRAEIEDRTTGDVRAYAIGDLLPHGSLLVGISTGAADIMVGDAQLVRLFDNGRIKAVEDLTAAFGPAPLSPARDLDPDYADKVRVAIVDLRSDDPAIVQAAIDELVASGDPAVEILIAHVDSLIPVHASVYAFPSGSDVTVRPRVVGDAVMLVLERITGQTFGDLAREDLTQAERRQIAALWRRWWGVD